MALTKDAVVSALRTCVDPEIPLNIVDLGLVYGVEVTPSPEAAGRSDVVVRMTLTSSGCPMSQSIARDVQRTLLRHPDVNHAKVELVWEPSWSPECISAEGRRHLQLN
ncbi:MAG TPA: metal-sulfur cluster assembly factor [Candidatus Synoicihabitans sp.]|nr:metal-sulfur cluster assembly factor [Candidatus Synoicihabitans sp.]